MKQAVILVLSVMALTFAATPMHADIFTNPPASPGSFAPGLDPLFDFTFSLGPDTGFGSINATDEGGGVFLATSGTVTVTGGSDIGTYSLVAGGPGGTLSPSGAFIYDNLVYPGNDPTLDGDGLLFAGGGLEINIWGNFPGDYNFDSFNGGGYNVTDEESGVVAFGVVTTPEPSAFFLLGSLLVGLGISRRRNSIGNPLTN